MSINDVFDDYTPLADRLTANPNLGLSYSDDGETLRARVSKQRRTLTGDMVHAYKTRADDPTGGKRALLGTAAAGTLGAVALGRALALGKNSPRPKIDSPILRAGFSTIPAMSIAASPYFLYRAKKDYENGNTIGSIMNTAGAGALGGFGLKHVYDVGKLEGLSKGKLAVGLAGAVGAASILPALAAAGHFGHTVEQFEDNRAALQPGKPWTEKMEDYAIANNKYTRATRYPLTRYFPNVPLIDQAISSALAEDADPTALDWSKHPEAFTRIKLEEVAKRKKAKESTLNRALTPGEFEQLDKLVEQEMLRFNEGG